MKFNREIKNFELWPKKKSNSSLEQGTGISSNACDLTWEF